MGDSEKKTKCGRIILSILLLIGTALLIFSIYYLNSEVNYLKSTTQHLEHQISDAGDNELRNISNKELDFYKDITDNAISRVNTAVGVMCAVASLFGLVGIIFTVISYTRGRDLEERYKEYETKLQTKIEEHRSEIDDINLIRHILYADKHIKSKKYNYAIAEYNDANKNKKELNDTIEYELGVLFADDYVSHYSEETFVKAENYLKRAIGIRDKKKITDRKDEEFLSDCYMILGGVYGLKAKKEMISEENDPNKYFEDSIECLEKAIVLNEFNLEAYTNLGVTYLYYNYYSEQQEKVDKAYKYFKKAIKMDWKNVKINSVIRRYHNVDELFSILKGEDKDKKDRTEEKTILDKNDERVDIQIRKKMKELDWFSKLEDSFKKIEDNE